MCCKFAPCCMNVLLLLLLLLLLLMSIRSHPCMFAFIKQRGGSAP